MYAQEFSRPQSAPTRGMLEDRARAKPLEWVRDLVEQDCGLAVPLLPEWVGIE